jgi:cytochrome c biogenesis protein CcmG, thiol:disulfide interchange protein DsbE
MRPSSNMAAPEIPAAGTIHAPRAPVRARRGWLRLFFFGPVALFLGLIAAFALGLGRGPKLVPSPLIGRPVQDFALPPVKGRSLGLAAGDLKGEVSLVNVFASWCVARREEHRLLMRLKAQGTGPIHGLNYKDKPDDAARWLDTMGDPYTRTGADINGRVAIDWGVYGVPETFVVDARGRIAFKQVGPITPEILERTILPLVAGLRSERSAGSGADP